MPDRRQLKRAERQLTLARIARRDAMAALADALAQEERSASLAERSRVLARGYGGQKPQSGEELARQSRIAAELAGLARTAEQARGDAARQADWQIDALAQAEQRMERLDERARAARGSLRDTQERLSQPAHGTMARKLLPSSERG